MTTVDLRIPGDLYDTLRCDVTKSFEWAGYLLCGVHRGNTDLLLGREWCPVPPNMQLADSGHGFSWHPDFDVQMLNRMQRENLACVVIHYHGGTAPALSGTDRKTAESLMPFLSGEASRRPHAFVVLGDRAASGLVYRDRDRIGSVGAVRVAGTGLDDWSVGKVLRLAPDERHDRLVRGFGDEAFRRLRGARVGVVGCGGGGSHLVQQLAYLGVGAMVLVDRDIVELTNLNRLIGALPPRQRRLIDRLLRRRDGDVGRLKVDVMERMVKAIDNGIDVTTIPESFPGERSVRALQECDIIIGCVDRLQVRDDLNRFCKRYLISMIDIGIEITPAHDSSGAVEAITGRVTKVLADGPCLRCQGVIDDAKLTAERDGKPLGYTGAARVPNPAVVTLNGIIASTAATEVLQMLTGFAGAASPNCGWIYDGIAGVTERVVKRFTGCDACRYERGLGDT